jgi:RNA recognition motif-containing protein
MEHFSQQGEITDVVIIRAKPKNISKGYGFVSTADRETYERILASRQELNGRVLDCFPGFKKAGHRELYQSLCDRKIFVGGFAADTTDQDLWDYFIRFGAVHKAYVIRDPNTNRSRKFGFVVMQQEEDADRVLECKYHLIKNVVITIKRFTNEEDYKNMKLQQKLAAEKQGESTENANGKKKMNTQPEAQDVTHKRQKVSKKEVANNKESFNEPQDLTSKNQQPKLETASNLDSQVIQLATFSQEMTATHLTRSRRNSRVNCSEKLQEALEFALPSASSEETNLRFNMCVDLVFYQKMTCSFIKLMSRTMMAPANTL